MKLSRFTDRATRTEPSVGCATCAASCDATCIVEAERDKMFQNLLRNGFRPL